MINQDAKNPVPPVTHTLPLSPSISLSLSLSLSLNEDESHKWQSIESFYIYI